MPDYPLLRSPLDLSVAAAPISAILEQRANLGQKSLSFEFFPPKDADAEQALWRAFDKLLQVSPDFVSVTYGAGGSNREKSLTVVQKMAGLVPTIGHLTCVGASKSGTLEILSHFRNAGVRSILALRGDAPKDDPQALSVGQLKTALDLVALARAESKFEIGVAAFPEGHPESPNLQHDAAVLAKKQQAGASYAITQLFFGLDHYQKLVEDASKAGATLPIIPGLMPVAKAKQVLRMASMSGAHVPQELVSRLESATETEARVIGMDYTINLGRQLLGAGAPGLHIFTLNQSVAAIELARGVGLCA